MNCQRNDDTGEATWGGEKTKQEDDYEDASFEVTFEMVEMMMIVMTKEPQDVAMVNNHFDSFSPPRVVQGWQGGLSANKCDPQYIDLLNTIISNQLFHHDDLMKIVGNR